MRSDREEIEEEVVEEKKAEEKEDSWKQYIKSDNRYLKHDKYKLRKKIIAENEQTNTIFNVRLDTVVFCDYDLYNTIKKENRRSCDIKKRP